MTTSLSRKDIPAKEHKMWKTQWDACTDALMEWLSDIAAEHKFKTTWAMWEVRDFTLVPFPDATQIIYTGGWGNGGVIELPENATWLQLWDAADKLILQSGDTHHIFIEDIYFSDVGVLSITTGS